MFINREWQNQLPNDPGIYILYDFDNDPIFIGVAHNLRSDISHRLLNDIAHNFRDIDYHDLARLRYWVYEDYEQAKELRNHYIAHFQPEGNTYRPRFPRIPVVQDDLPDEDDSTFIELSESRRGETLERIKYKSHLIHQIVLKADLIDFLIMKSSKYSKDLNRLYHQIHPSY